MIHRGSKWWTLGDLNLSQPSCVRRYSQADKCPRRVNLQSHRRLSMSTAGKERIVTVTISLILVVVLYSNLTLPKEYIIESNNLALSSSQDNSPELTAVSHWGGLGSTSSCQVHDSAQSADGNIGSSATFQMSQPSSSPSCDLAINLQYNYKVVNGSIIKPSYFDIEIEYSRSMPSEQNCAWVSILAVNGHSNPADGTVILNPLGNQPVQTYYSIGSSSCTDGTEHAVPLPSSPITTDMRDVSSQLQSYSNSQHSGFTIEIFVNPSDEPQFNLYIKEVTIIPSNTCLNDSDCDGISDSEEDNGDDDDIDGDGVGNDVDDFPLDSSEWSDNDGDGLGDNGDIDDDNDGISDISDAFPLDNNEWFDTDNDGIGNNADTDDDNDGIPDADDWATLDSSEWLDTDNDGIGNNQDIDDDGDGWSDMQESNCETDPLISWFIPLDTDSDGECDILDSDDDGDGHLDVSDWAPLDANEWLDTDGDGIGNNADVDDDNDSVNDAEDPDSQDPEIWGDAYDDYDNDGVLNYEDVFPSDPTRTLDDDGDGLAVEDEGSILDNIHETNLPMFLSVVYVILIIGLTFIANIIHKRYNE